MMRKSTLLNVAIWLCPLAVIPFVKEISNPIFVGLVVSVVLMSVLWLVQSLLEGSRELLGKPIKLKVILRKLDGENNCYATVYIDRRTGALSAPTNASERVLEVAGGEELSENIFGAPYYEKLWAFHPQKKIRGVQMLMAEYTFP